MPRAWEQLVNKLKGRYDNPYAVATGIMQNNHMMKRGTREFVSPEAAQKAARLARDIKKKRKK